MRDRAIVSPGALEGEKQLDATLRPARLACRHLHLARRGALQRFLDRHRAGRQRRGAIRVAAISGARPTHPNAAPALSDRGHRRSCRRRAGSQDRPRSAFRLGATAAPSRASRGVTNSRLRMATVACGRLAHRIFATLLAMRGKKFKKHLHPKSQATRIRSNCLPGH